MYSIAWKYTIQTVFRKEFEREFGPKGSWVKLFSKSKEFVSSLLQKDVNDRSSYLLIDTWTSGEAYQQFLETNEKQYQSLSGRFESIIKKEEKIGEFQTLD